MSEKGILKILREYGLSKREADVYIFLSKKGIQPAHSISSSLKIERVQTYRALKSLQEKGVVEATLEAPTRFSAIPFETMLDSLIKKGKSKITELETEKDDLISYWKSLRTKVAEYPLAKFRVLTERRRIHEEMTRMMQETKNELLELTTSQAVIQEDIAGILDSIISYAQKNSDAQFKILANISNENQEIISQMLKKISAKNLNIQWRHIDLGSRLYPQFTIKDSEETILYVTSQEELPLLSQADTGLWISSKMFVSTLRESFMDMWRNAVRAEERIEQLKTGKPLAETAIIRDAKEAQTKLEKALETAQEDIIAIVSSDGIKRISENNFLQKYTKKGLRFRIMAPIDLDNFEAANKLSEICQIRNVSISYLSMLLADNKHLFIFKTPLIGKMTAKTTFHVDDAFYTTDARYVERVNEMLNDIWKRGIDINETLSGPATKALNVQVSRSDTISKVIDYMLKNNVNSVIVTEDNNNPIGIISEKDLLEKIVKPRRDPEKTHADEVMSLPVVDIESDEPFIDALKTMRNTGIQKLAVFKNGKLAGMLTLKKPSKT